MQRIQRLGRSNGYWLSMIIAGLAMEGVALYYQYALNQYPCVLCIHARIWVLGLVIVGALGLILKRSRVGVVSANLLGLIVGVGLAERSWQLLVTERGWSTDLTACSIESGLPPWFALDTWFPAVFGVQATCGYTPVLAFNVTMAEALIAIAALIVAVTALVAVATLKASPPPVSSRDFA